MSECIKDSTDLSKIQDLSEGYSDKFTSVHQANLDSGGWAQTVSSTDAYQQKYSDTLGDSPTAEDLLKQAEFGTTSVKLTRLNSSYAEYEKIKNLTESLDLNLVTNDGTAFNLLDEIDTSTISYESIKSFNSIRQKIYDFSQIQYDGSDSGLNTESYQKALNQIDSLNQIIDSANYLNDPTVKSLIQTCPEQLEQDAEKEYKEGVNELLEPVNDSQSSLDSVAIAAVAAVAPGLAGALQVANTLSSLDASDEKAKLAEKQKKEAEAAIEASLAEEVIFQEQCFLLANLAELVEHKKSLSGSFELPYAGGIVPSNHPIHIQGDAFAFTNKLAVSPTQKELFELTEPELSSLTPHMRFFKVESGDDGKDIEVEIKFDSNSSNDLNDYMSRRKTKTGGRGLGVGVKSFTFSYDGTDPFSAKKAISAKLSIYSPSFTELLKDRGEYRYVDLALKTGAYKTADIKAAEKLKETLSDKERQNLDKLNFRLKVLVEWTASQQATKLLDSTKKKALYNSAISIYLTPTIHEFDFDDAGGVEFSINYLAYIEDYFAQPSFDIFGSLGPDKKARNFAFEYLRQTDCDYGGVDYSQFRANDETYISKSNAFALQKFIRKIRKNDKMYYLSISKNQMRKWLKEPWKNDYITQNPPKQDLSIDKQIVTEATTAASKVDEDKRSAFRLSLVSNSDLVENVSFMYVSDLIDAAMSNVEESLKDTTNILDTKYVQGVLKSGIEGSEFIESYIKEKDSQERQSKKLATIEQFKKIRIVLGPMEVVPYSINSSSKRAISCTIGDIPISLNYFLDFMSERVLSKDFVEYPFSKFVKDLLNDCIRNFINSDSCFSTDTSQKVSINSTSVLAYNMKEGGAKDDLSNLILEGVEGGFSKKNCLLLNNEMLKNKLPILKISGPQEDFRKTLNIEDMINYYIFTIGRKYPIDAYTGDKQKDSENGVFHYVLGARKGIVKNISLDKTTTPGLKELRFEQEGFDGLTQLREVYNANITTFLNPQTFPGTYIYVEPRGFDPTATEDLTRYGIGGYYMITKTTHQISPGNAETVLNAAWVASKGGKAIKDEGGEKREKQNKPENVKKCKVQALQSTVNER